MDLSVVVNNIPALVDGTIITLEITVLSVAIGFVMALFLSVLSISKNKFIQLPVKGFIFYFRGTPLLVQIFIIYFGSGQFQGALSAMGLWHFFRKPFFCAVLSLALNTAAYSAEILRGGIEGVDFGEIEAARACGMSGFLLYRRIIMPAAIRIAWPAYTNEVVFLLQATSLVSIITLMDITGVARLIASRTFAFYEIFLTAAAIYLVLVYGLLFVFKKIEKKITAHLNPEAAAA